MTEPASTALRTVIHDLERRVLVEHLDGPELDEGGGDPGGEQGNITEVSPENPTTAMAPSVEEGKK